MSVVYICPRCGYRTKPQPDHIITVTHRCPTDSVDRRLKPVRPEGDDQ